MRPIVDQLKLLIRFNPQSKCVELKVDHIVTNQPRLLLTQLIVVLFRKERIIFMLSCLVLKLMMLLLSFVSMIYILVWLLSFLKLQKRSRSRMSVCSMAITLVVLSVVLPVR